MYIYSIYYTCYFYQSQHKIHKLPGWKHLWNIEKTAIFGQEKSQVPAARFLKTRNFGSSVEWDRCETCKLIYLPACKTMNSEFPKKIVGTTSVTGITHHFATGRFPPFTSFLLHQDSPGTVSHVTSNRVSMTSQDLNSRLRTRGFCCDAFEAKRCDNAPCSHRGDASFNPFFFAG